MSIELHALPLPALPETRLELAGHPPAGGGPTPSPAPYPVPKPPESQAQSHRTSILGLGKQYDETLAGNKRFQAEVTELLREHGIPANATQARYIVSGLLFLSRFDAPQLDGDYGHQVRQYAQARLDAFLGASKTHAFGLANVRNDALAMVNKYLTHGLMTPNLEPPQRVPGRKLI